MIHNSLDSDDDFRSGYRTSANVITDSPSEDYTHLDDHTLPSYDLVVYCCCCCCCCCCCYATATSRSLNLNLDKSSDKHAFNTTLVYGKVIDTYCITLLPEFRVSFSASFMTNNKLNFVFTVSVTRPPFTIPTINPSRTPKCSDNFCQQECRDIPNEGAKCYCRSGYQLQADRVSCRGKIERSNQQDQRTKESE